MKKRKVTLESINIQHAKSVVLCVLLLLAAVPVSVLEWKIFDFSLGMLLVVTSVVGWTWSSIESNWHRRSWLSGHYDNDDKYDDKS